VAEINLLHFFELTFQVLSYMKCWKFV